MSTRDAGGAHPPTTFRLEPEVLDDLAVIADHLTAERRRRATKADAVRYAAKLAADRIRRKAKKEAEE